jgi:chromosome segregation ATPase
MDTNAQDSSTKTPYLATGTDAETLRKQLDTDKAEVEKLTQKNAFNTGWLAKMEKAEADVAKALGDYGKVFTKLQLAKQDAEADNESELKESAAEIGAKAAQIDPVVTEVDTAITDLQKEVDDSTTKKNGAETKFFEAQKTLTDAQAVLQTELTYQAGLSANLKAAADAEGKVKRTHDHEHPAEFYFYTREVERLLGDAKVKTPDELKTDLGETLAAVQKAFADLLQAKVDLVDVSVDLDAKQKQLAELRKNRETQILARIKEFDAPDAPKPAA